MTQSDRQQWHDLLNALADGELQVNLRTKDAPIWTSASYLNTEVGPAMFRRKPKSREFWVNIYSNGIMAVYPSPEEAAKYFDEYSTSDVKAIRVREVLD